MQANGSYSHRLFGTQEQSSEGGLRPVLSSLGYELIVIIIDTIQADPFSAWYFHGFVASIIGLLTVMPFILNEIDLTFILFWAGLAPSI
jgi:hypothetical protein